MYLEISLDKSWLAQKRKLATSSVLGKASIPNKAYRQQGCTVLAHVAPIYKQVVDELCFPTRIIVRCYQMCGVR